MKEERRAAEHEIAHNRCVTALEQLFGGGHEKIRELRDVRMRRMSPAVAAMEEQKVMADILEDLASGQASQYPSDPVDESTVQLLSDAGYDSLEAIREGTDENLLAIKGIGPAKLAEIREKVG
jgi:DNA-directed RNA polymerase alpha subunit